MRSRIVTWVLVAAMVVLPSAFAAELRASKAAVRKEVIAAVGGQLEAFRAGDAQKAYGFAAAPLRAQTSLRNFVAILQANYPEIWANSGAEYGIVRDDGARATLLVHVTSPSGEATFNYVLLKERGGWRIGSVVRHVGRKRDDV
jgi:hypothetical protein